MKTFSFLLILSLFYSFFSEAQIYDLENGKETITIQYSPQGSVNGPIIKFKFKYVPYKYMDSYRIGYSLIGSSFELMYYQFDGKRYSPAQLGSAIMKEVNYNNSSISLTGNVVYFNRLMLEKDFLYVLKDQQMGAFGQSDEIYRGSESFNVSREDWERGISIKNIAIKSFSSSSENNKIEKFIRDKNNAERVSLLIRQGESYLGQNRLNDSKQAFQGALKLDPSNQVIVGNLNKIQNRERELTQNQQREQEQQATNDKNQNKADFQENTDSKAENSSDSSPTEELHQKYDQQYNTKSQYENQVIGTMSTLGTETVTNMLTNNSVFDGTYRGHFLFGLGIGQLDYEHFLDGPLTSELSYNYFAQFIRNFYIGNTGAGLEIGAHYENQVIPDLFLNGEHSQSKMMDIISTLGINFGPHFSAFYVNEWTKIHHKRELTNGNSREYGTSKLLRTDGFGLSGGVYKDRNEFFRGSIISTSADKEIYSGQNFHVRIDYRKGLYFVGLNYSYCYMNVEDYSSVEVSSYGIRFGLGFPF